MDNKIICPECGNYMGWDNDYDLEDVVGQELEEDQQSFVTCLTCQNCGTYMELYYPSQEIKNDHPEYWKKEKMKNEE